ncbi:IMP dehydrogenase [Fructobacillus sp. W13]|uniref:IMP dehydrogenase n=1 Tax=Fructobacillus apis TaxID=2935017 RepID=A0ABT0ZNR0_9LACO|nr:IMP dehydrogenase [Fructobacillus apis]
MDAINHGSSIKKTTPAFDYQAALVDGTDAGHGLGYDETLLVPAASNVLPHTVALETTIGKLTLANPLAATDLTGKRQAALAKDMAEAGALGIVPAEEKIEDQVALVKEAKSADSKGSLAAEVWLADDSQVRVAELVTAGADAIVLYLPKALDEMTLTAVSDLKAALVDATLIVGTIEDAEAAQKLAKVGVDAVIAGRSVDSKWADDAHYPFLTTVMTVVEALAGQDTAVIAAGGIHYSGDVVKAIAGGADVVMISDFLPREAVVEDAVFQMDGGLRAGMGYTGSQNVEALRMDAQFVQITDNGLKESHPHDVEITKKAPNYVEQERD